MKCPVCRITGGNMRKCKKCGQIYCKSCAFNGRGHYPRVRASNQCPYCGKLDCSETAK